jgi:hypothetical protein
MTLKADLNEALERAAKRQRMTRQYLGDSVYVEQDDLGRLWLFTDNCYGYGPDNKICLEWFVYQSLVDYVAWLKTKAGETEDGERADKA